jgi:hypothetical protein
MIHLSVADPWSDKPSHLNGKRLCPRTSPRRRHLLHRTLRYSGAPRALQPRAAVDLRSAHQQQQPLCRGVVSKTSLTLSDAIGAARLQLWIGDINQHSPPHHQPQYIPENRAIRMAQALSFAT